MVRIERYLRQACYYWAPDGRDSGGEPTYSEPTKIACRWDDVQEQFFDEKGQLTISASKVLVGQDLVMEGLLALSENADLEDWSDLPYPSDPLDDDNPPARTIRSFSKIPDRRGRMAKGVRIAML